LSIGVIARKYRIPMRRWCLIDPWSPRGMDADEEVRSLRFGGHAICLRHLPPVTIGFPLGNKWQGDRNNTIEEEVRSNNRRRGASVGNTRGASVGRGAFRRPRRQPIRDTTHYMTLAPPAPVRVWCLMGNHVGPAGSYEGGSVWSEVGVCNWNLPGKCPC
jgi:hypothetical protein